ncbi:UNVERIFIED_CONTAM: hypothetical protein GTU68_018871 [Idotea baltica]|nr:hypothetical protein [Idotea baltica]
MPRSWYAARIADGTITHADLQDAAGSDQSVETLKEAALTQDEVTAALPTIADLAADVSGIDWPGFIDERVGAWAAGYFDTGQALWQVTPGLRAFDSWKIFASRDLTPEIAGLSGFAFRVAKTPERVRTALALACDALGVGPAASDTYFHQLLLALGGWSQLARQKLWQAELTGKKDPITTDMLTIRLVWEQALFEQYKDEIGVRWSEVLVSHAEPVAVTSAQTVNTVLQHAAERASQRKLAAALSQECQERAETRPVLQAAFCIDVRSEVFRRALETLDDGIGTLGFAGFFGLTTAHHGFASDVAEHRLPVLLAPALESASTDATVKDADQDARLSARASRAWGRFRLAAVSSFAFVEATGPVYAGKLLRDALGLPAVTAPDTHIPRFSDTFALQDRITTAAAILRAMSLTQNFAPLVLIVGHGANVVNNPHASALHCGACGGYSGDVNARLLAGLLNDATVRSGLQDHGINIPKDTIFIGALHDTTTDAVTLFKGDVGQAIAASNIVLAEALLASAGKIARTERALRLPRALKGEDIARRSKDWSETRPEWALAGCSAFIAASRHRTRGKALEGRAFLHDYDWREDAEFAVLEQILTAPVVVASWISLQYYGSVVAPDIFGAGNKLLHNVTGGLGVVEGNGGRLRGGLPLQSVHDGSGYIHDPLRLSVCVEAPKQAVTDILKRHGNVRDLFDNRWLHLFVMDEGGRLSERYVGDLKWESLALPPSESHLGTAAQKENKKFA